jgi:hypothetical protein
VFVSGSKTGIIISGVLDMGKALSLKIGASDLHCNVVPVDIQAGESDTPSLKSDRHITHSIHGISVWKTRCGVAGEISFQSFH